MRRGFTLIDVLVTLGVIAVLLAILMPSLSSVRETARQVVCRSNIRQVGIGLGLFAEDNQDHLPKSSCLEGSSPQPRDTITLRTGGIAGWDGEGLLYLGEYMPAPLIFYCPSHHGSHPYWTYADAWAGQSGPIVGNYQYRGRGPSQASGAGNTDLLSGLRPGTTLLVDGLRCKSDFNHLVGANVFRADGTVSWFSGRGGGLMAMIPPDDQSPSAGQIEGIWNELDLR